MTDRELAGCPWCGEKLSVVSVSEGSTFRWRKVDGCCTDGPEVRHDTLAEDQVAAEADSRQRAIAAWNRRTPAVTPDGELSEVLALLEKATPGPWVSVARGDYGSGAEGSVDGAGEADVEPAVAPPYDAPTIRGEVMLADAEAIAAAVNFLRKHGPGLLAALSTPSSEGDG